MNDEWIEFIPVPSGTPAEIVGVYARIVNDAFSKSESMYSSRWEAMLEKDLCAHWLEEIKNEFFVGLRYQLVHRKSREEYLGIEED